MSEKVKEFDIKLRDRHLDKYDSSDIKANLKTVQVHQSKRCKDVKHQHIPKKMVDETFFIDKKIGAKLMNDFSGKFGIKADQVKPMFSTIPIERTSCIDYDKLYEAKV